MAISSGGGGNDTPMSDINTTPLVDVMLVLLIVFLIAIPVAIQTVTRRSSDLMSGDWSSDVCSSDQIGRAHV